MMLIAFTLVAIACGAAPARIASPLPLPVVFAPAATVSPSLARRVQDEAAAVWKAAGVAVVWQRADDRRPTAVEVVVDDDRGGASPLLRLGWIVFDEHGIPARTIHVSQANAMTLLEESRTVVGNPNAMPISERETYLGRAMGRALAHELGHFLFASRVHTPTGLMRATMTAVQLFSPVRLQLAIPPPLVAALLTRLAGSAAAPASP